MTRDTAWAMSQENVELLHRAFEAVNGRDLDLFLALSDPDVEFSPLIVKLEGGDSYRGHDSVRRWWEDLFGVFPDYRIEADEVRDLGNVTVTCARAQAHGVESNVLAEQQLWAVTEWRSGKTVWWANFISEAAALEAAGLRE